MRLSRAALVPLLLLALALPGCTLLPGPDRAGAFPLVEDGRVRPGTRRLVVAIPGAFSSVGIFRPVLAWQDPGSAVVAYRFPGMDGLPLDHRVDIDGSAQVIADYVNEIAPDRVDLIGYSTGGPIAIETAQRLDAPDVSIALVSTAGPAPSGALSSLRSGIELLRAMLRAHTSDPQAALTENYRTLLYGEDGLKDPDRARETADMAEAQRENMAPPSIRRSMAHTASLMFWTLDRPGGLSDAHIGLFHGTEDTVFPLRGARRLAARLPADRVTLYEGQGHLLFVTSGRLFDDIHAFFRDGP